MSPDFGEVIDTGPPHRMAGAHLKKHVDERARFKISALEPVGEHIEDGQELLFWRVRPLTCLANDRVHSPYAVALFEEGEHHLVLRREVAVEGRLGDAGPADEFVDANIPHAPPGKEIVGGVDDALPDSGRADGCCAWG